jgi:hypothetical protein
MLQLRVVDRWDNADEFFGKWATIQRIEYKYGLNGSPLDLNPQDPPMSETSAEHHTKAAEHHEHAARHHKEAAKHYTAGNHEKAGHHAHLAHGHHLHATHHAGEAAKRHTQDHGSK